MTPTLIHRHSFTQKEVIAVLLPDLARCDGQEMRIDADGYVVIDLVNPSVGAEAPAVDQAPPTALADQDAPQSVEEPPTAPPERPQGRIEQEAVALCQRQAFQTFLEVKTATAAIRVLATRCHIEDLSVLDRGKSYAAQFRDVAAEFEAWMMT